MTVAEVRELLREADRAEFEALERSLSADTRKGVAAALASCRKRLEAEEAELKRLSGLYAFDAAGLSETGGLCAGLDEVGRGAIAGPLAVGAVVLDREAEMIEGLDDSKRLRPEERERIAEEIKGKALAWSVFYVEPDQIDARGMSECLRVAFRGALAEVDKAVRDIKTVLLDGNPLHIDPREVNVVKGDATSASIAAASIVAKVERDSLMNSLSSTYPHYGFAQNKGYGGSSAHTDAIREYGLSPVHRRSFCQSFLQESLF